MIGEVARYEVRLQLREFLTWVYVAVFFLLALGHASSGAVELVSGRGEVPKWAPWAVAHATAGVTAFGQVITTMIAATAVLRDVAMRQQELLFTTRLTQRDYLLGRWLGALATMGLVYLAIPAGLLLGLGPSSTPSVVRAFVLFVVPNVLVVSVLFFVAGALGRGFMSILLLGVGLVALWGTGISLVRDGVVAGAWLDPFGNAALEWVTRDWDTAARSAAAIPAGAVLLGNRALWITIAAVAGAVLSAQDVMQLASPATASARGRVPPLATGKAHWTTTPPAAWTTILEQASWVFRWTWREKGFVTLAALGALNALANTWRAGGATPTTGELLLAVHTHARVFLILVATIYAGELVWRDRDVRVAELIDSTPAGTAARVTGGVLGVLAAQALLVLPLLCVVLGTGWGRGVEGFAPWLAAGWLYGVTWTFVAQVTLVSLLVHVLVQHKVAGHFLLIAGWVAAVAIDRVWHVPDPLRYGTLPDGEWELLRTAGAATSRVVALEVWWCVLGAMAAMVAVWRWHEHTGQPCPPAVPADV